MDLIVSVPGFTCLLYQYCNQKVKMTGQFGLPITEFHGCLTE